MADGMSVDEIRSMCDLHAEVLRDVVKPIQIRTPIAPGHPVDTFQRENVAIREAVARARQALDALASAEPPARDALDACRAQAQRADRCREALPAQGEPALLLPRAARHHRALEGDVGQGRRGARAAAGARRGAAGRGATAAEWRLVATTVGEPALAAVEEMIYKEETDPPADGARYAHRGRVGRDLGRSRRATAGAWSSPATGYQPPRGRGARATPSTCPRTARWSFLPGHLTFDQLRGLFSTLPVDLTFVDADDRVAFFSEGPDRVFARSQGHHRPQGAALPPAARA